jgi:hypothetical protein
MLDIYKPYTYWHTIPTSKLCSLKAIQIVKAAAGDK